MMLQMLAMIIFFEILLYTKEGSDVFAVPYVDFPKVLDRISSKKLQKAQVTAEVVPEPDCILVQGRHECRDLTGHLKSQLFSATHDVIRCHVAST